jgi:hypothetical protein
MMGVLNRRPALIHRLSLIGGVLLLVAACQCESTVTRLAAIPIDEDHPHGTRRPRRCGPQSAIAAALQSALEAGIRNAMPQGDRAFSIQLPVETRLDDSALDKL